jgi:tRNA(Met) C34 N-acetyltransferase TmcA
MNCARQTGKSTAAGILALHKALSAAGSLVLILAPAERQAKELFSKVAGFYHALGHPIPADSHRKLDVELANGSRIEALPGSERTIRGFSGVDLLLVDEASRVEDALYHAVRPMLATSAGRLILLFTPAGKRGSFFEE